jgi:hypothetical protein
MNGFKDEILIRMIFFHSMEILLIVPDHPDDQQSVKFESSNSSIHRKLGKFV